MPKVDDIKKRGDSDLDQYSNFEPAGNSTSGDFKFAPKFSFSDARQGVGGFAKKIRHQKIKFRLSLSWRALLTLIIVFGLGTVALSRGITAKNNVEKLTKEAQGHLSSSFSLIENGDVSGAIDEASQAKMDLAKIKLLAQSWGQDIAYLRIASASNSKLIASERLLDASFNIIDTISSVDNELQKISFAQKGSAENGESGIFFDISGNQKVLLSAISNGENKLNKGKAELLAARKGLDGSQADQVDSALSAIDSALQRINDSRAILGEDLTWLSGADGREKNILILFQNNAELRGASGGSLGSFGIAKFKNGNLEGIDFGINIFKIDKPFQQKNKIPVPDQLNWILPENSLAMKDSGWDIDGPTAMEKIMWFYKQETGNDVDGTIMVDSSAVVSLLGEIGAISIPEIGKTIDSKNFEKEIESEVHDNYFDTPEGKAENEPKKILALMMPKFMDQLFSSLKDQNQSSKVFSTLSKSLKQKDITMYFTNQEFEKRLLKLNYSAAMNSGMGDYIYLTNSNVDGGKSSQAVQESLALTTEISGSGLVNNTLLITRKYSGSNDWFNGTNKNFVRLALPENTNIDRFDPQEGYFEQFMNRGYKDGQPYWLTSEHGRKIVNFWMTTQPKEESRVEISYLSDYAVNTSGDFYYALTLQKQTGAPIDDVSLTLNYPQGFTPENVKNYDDPNNRLVLKLKLNQDKTIKIRFKKTN